MLQIDGEGKSDIGKVRQANQDAFAVDQDHLIYIVADGMGGHSGGEIASWKAVEAALAVIRQGVTGNAGATPEMLKKLIVQSVQSANEEVHRMASEDRALHGMGTTLVLLCVHDATAYIGSVGDSRVYLWRNAQLRQVTHDHSLVNEYVRLGTLSAEEASTHPLKHIISRAVGVHQQVEVDHFEVPLKPDDLFILCSDGLTNMLDNDEMGTILSGVGNDAAKTCQELITRANAKGGLDNITIVALRCVSI